MKPLEEAYRARVQSCTLSIVAERNTLAPDELRKTLGVRPSQLRRVVIQANEADETQTLTVQLARISNDEIQVGVKRLRREPGVQSLEVVEKQRRKAGGRKDSDL